MESLLLTKDVAPADKVVALAKDYVGGYFENDIPEDAVKHSRDYHRKLRLFFTEGGCKYLFKALSNLGKIAAHIFFPSAPSSIAFTAGSCAYGEHLQGLAQGSLRYRDNKKKRNVLNEALSAGSPESPEPCPVHKPFRSQTVGVFSDRLQLPESDVLSKPCRSLSMDSGSARASQSPGLPVAEAIEMPVVDDVADEDDILPEDYHAGEHIYSLLYGEQGERLKRKQQRVQHDVYIAAISMFTYAGKTARDICNTLLAQVKNLAPSLLKLCVSVAGMIVYPLSVLISLYGVVRDGRDLRTLDRLCTNIQQSRPDKNMTGQLAGLLHHLSLSGDKKIWRMFGNALNFCGYACSLLATILSLAGAGLALLSPVGWLLAGLGAACLFAVLLHRLISHYINSARKEICLEILQQEPDKEISDDLKQRFQKSCTIKAGENDEDEDVRQLAVQELWKMGSRYAVLHFVTHDLKKYSAGEDAAVEQTSVADKTYAQEEKGRLNALLMVAFEHDAKKVERFMRLGRYLQDETLAMKLQVRLLCERLKIESKCGGPLQHDFFERVQKVQEAPADSLVSASAGLSVGTR